MLREPRIHTLGQTGTQETGNLLDEGVGSKEGIVLASKLLDELLVLVELLQVISRHGIDAVVLGTVEIVLVTKNTADITVSKLIPITYVLPHPSPDDAYQDISSKDRSVGKVDIPDGHVGAGNGGQLDGARETLVTLGVVVLQTDLKLDGLEEVSLLLILRVVEQLLDILAHSGCNEVTY